MCGCTSLDLLVKKSRTKNRSNDHPETLLSERLLVSDAESVDPLSLSRGSGVRIYLESFGDAVQDVPEIRRDGHLAGRR